MTINLNDYVAAGYFLSRWTDIPNCIGHELRRVTMANDHTQRRFFPDEWTLSWCKRGRKERLAAAEVFGISASELRKVMVWADAAFNKLFGPWTVIYSFDDAQAIASKFLRNAKNVELWGVGLHRSLVKGFCVEVPTQTPEPGCAPQDASSTHLMVCKKAGPLVSGGLILGHEILTDDNGDCFNSPESLHLDEASFIGEKKNSFGLIDRFEDALEICQRIEPSPLPVKYETMPWWPRLIVKYPLVSTDSVGLARDR